MPVTTTIGEQVLEAVVAGPDEANRLFTITGAANVGISVSENQQKTETWTFLVGPTFTRAQLYRAIGAALVSSQFVYVNPPPPMGTGWTGSFQVQINSVEADWDDESGRVEVRVEVLLGAGQSTSVTINQLRYWVTILARITD